MSITVNGTAYDVIVSEVTRKATVKEGSLAGDTKDGKRFRDIVGTYFDFTLTISPKPGGQATYDALYDVLTTPQESVKVALPVTNQAQEFEAYIDTVTDVIVRQEGADSLFSGMSVTFLAAAPQREA